MKNIKYCTWLLVVAMPLIAHVLNAAGPANVSMTELLKSPQKFSGAYITTTGFFKLSHRGPMLFISKDDLTGLVIMNMIPLQPSLSMEKTEDAIYNGKRVSVTGKFTAYSPDKVVVSKGFIIYDHIEGKGVSSGD